MRKLKSGGGWQAVRYSVRLGHEVGYLPLWKAMTSRNACKTCALGMGGQQGGMRNETGHFPEVCKKSFQAMAADMRGRIDPDFFATYSIAQLRTLSSRELELTGRIADPLLAEPGATHYRVTPWEEAIPRVSEAMREAGPRRSFFYSSGRSSNEAGFVLQLLARVFGTNHVNNCSYYCHQASGVGLMDSIGSATATISLEDLEQSDLVFLIGGNPASNHPRLMTSLMRLRNRGGHVVVVNPVRELGLRRFRVPSNVASMLFGTEIASTYAQIGIGGDIAFLAGVAKGLLERGAFEGSFIGSATEGFEAVRSYVSDLPWQEIERRSGVPKSVIDEVAERYAKAERVVFAWTMGITHHEHGVENVQWIVNLALMRGMVGKPGAGLMPVRGHSNVQGLGTVGVAPYMAKAAVEGLTALGVPVPAFKGYDTLSAMEAAERGEMDFALCLGGNLYGANPDAQFASSALAKLGTVVYLSTTLNTGHAHGLGRQTLILPVLARDEERQVTTQESMFNFVRLSDGGIERYKGPWSEVDVLAEAADRLLGSEPIDWFKLKDHDEVRRLIARLVPKLKEIEKISETRKEFSIPGRVLHQPKFATESGRAAFHAHPIPEPPALRSDELRIMTVRSEGQFNTVVYDEEDLYRNQERRDVILMSAGDIRRLGLSVDQRVDVRNATGCVEGMLVREFDIAPGGALMYYPEANALVPRSVDPRSRTPAFKSVVASVRPS
jgi:molybdopterin-dependent oxidoreductase alpha subunit